MVLPWDRQSGFEVSRVHYTESCSSFNIRCLDRGLGVVTSWSEVSGPDLHLGAFGGVFQSFPVIPVHAVSVRRVLTVEVQAVQIGHEAGAVPPAAVVVGAVHLVVMIVVSVMGAEGHRIVPDQWRTRCTWGKYFQIIGEWHFDISTTG